MKSTPPFNMDNHVESECLAFMQQAINSNNPRRIYDMAPNFAKIVLHFPADLNIENERSEDITPSNILNNK